MLTKKLLRLTILEFSLSVNLAERSDNVGKN